MAVDQHVANMEFDNEVELDCDRNAAFNMDPKKAEARIGYVLAMEGFGVQSPKNSGLARDLRLATPYNSSTNPNFKGVLNLPVPPALYPVGIAPDPASVQHAFRQPMISVVGVISKFVWKGGVCDPVIVEFYCSQENALLMRQRQNISLPHTKITRMVWWIVNFDQETKRWYEQCYPAKADGILGHITGRNKPMLDVRLVPEKVSDQSDLNVYYCKIGLVPQGVDVFKIVVAASSKSNNVVKQWGVQIGDGSSV